VKIFQTSLGITAALTLELYRAVVISCASIIVLVLGLQELLAYLRGTWG